MRENMLGRLVRAHWLQIPRQFATVELDAFVLMPNHVHGIIHLQRRVTANEEQYKRAEFAKPQIVSLSWIVRAFKARLTREARQVLRRPDMAIWQRNYFERVVRDAKEYADIYHYIRDNPSNWDHDNNNLAASGPRSTNL